MAHFTVTHGCGLVAGGGGTGITKGHPATAAIGVAGLEMVVIGWPLTTTRGWVGAIVAFAR